MAQGAVVASNWPTAVTVVVGLAITGWLNWYQMKANAAKTNSIAKEGVEIAKESKAMLNSHLDEYKRILDENSTRALDLNKQEFAAAMAKINSDNAARIALDKSEFEKRIAKLENMISVLRPQDTPVGPTIVPVQIVNPDPVPVVQTPESRLSEIRGEQPK